ncbi:MAG: HAD family hydrolase [Gammaproteobacteria bacterium]|nr:HAD family hydrolase [Gammaproteobacteria bacterium]
MKALIFDIDGTLLVSSAEDDRLYRRAVGQVLGSVSFRDNLHDYAHVSDTGILTQVFEDNGVALEQSLFDAVKSAFFAALEEHIAEYGPFSEVPGAADYLRRIMDSPNHEFAIATGGWRESARMKLGAAGLPCDDAPLASSDDAVDRADIMRHALRSLSGEFSSVTYYGDGPWDRSASEALGWDFIGVGRAIAGIDTYHGELLE